ncbi:helix-turn-helix transcriptional regulator [Ralstonia wenshanensis]|uniref:helix-turn-helix transcriptional regulator n=1 Tax=Ralstonia wenshanensis TaxID=2842456 RepID=UPI003D95472C
MDTRKEQGEIMAREASDFRVAFAQMDGAALLTPDEFGELIGKTRNAIYHILCRDPAALPTPVFRQNRYVRWRASDVRDWITSLPCAKPREIGDKPRRGRRRKAADAI